MTEEKSRLVYSTDQSVPKKDKSAHTTLRADVPLAPQKVYVRVDRKGRGGKSVTVIEGLPMSSKDKEILLRQLKTRLGTGGVKKDDWLEIQGDRRDAIITFLEGMGYKPTRAGG